MNDYADSDETTDVGKTQKLRALEPEFGDEVCLLSFVEFVERIQAGDKVRQ